MARRIFASDGVTLIKRSPVPDLVTIYDQAGTAYHKFPIDAREAVESGRYSYAREGAEDRRSEEAETSVDSAGGEPDVSEDPGSDSSSEINAMTKTELIAAIRERGGQANSTLSKDELAARLTSLIGELQ